MLDLTLTLCNGIEHWTRFESGVVSLLALLPNLQELTLYEAARFMVPGKDMYALQHLSCLQGLILDFSCLGRWEHDTLQPLSHLKSLDSLEIRMREMAGPLLVHSSLSSLTCLTSLCLVSEGSEDASDELDAIDTDNIVDVVSHLTGLQSLTVEGVMDVLPASLLTLQQLSALHCGRCHLLWPGLPSTPCTQWNGLQRIWLGHVPAMDCAVWQSFCSMLASLPELSNLALCFVELAHIPSHCWDFNRQLKELRLIDCNLQAVPLGMERMTQLQQLFFLNEKNIGLTQLVKLLRILPKLHLNAAHALSAMPELRQAAALSHLVLRPRILTEDSMRALESDFKPHLQASCSISFTW